MTLRSSVGWPLTGPIRTVSSAPLASSPNTNVSSSRPIPTAAQVYL